LVVPPALVVPPTRAFRACPPPPPGSAADSPADVSIPVRVRRRRRGPGAGPILRPRRNSAVRPGGRWPRSPVLRPRRNSPTGAPPRHIELDISAW